MEQCNHREYKKCGISWTDKRRDNRVDKSMFVYTKDMLIDWLDGYSYNTLERNYKLSPYYVRILINTIINESPDYRKLIENHIDCLQITNIGLDGGYFNSSKGKVGYLLAVDLDSNTVVHYARLKEKKIRYS